MTKLVASDEDAINQALSNGFIVPVSANRPSYRFTHDFIQQAAYSLIPTDDLKTNKLQLSKLLWDNMQSEACDDYLNTIANLINSSLSIVQDKQERKKIAELNLKVGIKAKLSGAFDLARGYFQVGINILDLQWAANYDLTLKLYDELAEVAYCSENYSLMKSTIEIVLKNAVSNLDRVNVFTLQLRKFTVDKAYGKAVEFGFVILEKLGETFPASITETTLISAVMELKQVLFGNMAHISALPVMKEKVDLTIMDLLLNLGHACFPKNKKYCAMLALRMINITLQRGLSQYSSCGFVLIGSFLCGIGDFFNGFEFGSMSLMLVEMFPIKEIIMKVHISVYGFINVWSKSIQLSLDPILKAIEIAREFGCVEYYVVSSSLYYHLALFSGMNLNVLNDEIEELEKYSASPVTDSIHHLVLRFLGKDGCYPTSAFLEKITDELNTFIIHLHIIIIDYNFYDYESAAEIIKSSKPFSSNITCMVAYSVYIFYQGMVSIAQVKKLSANDSAMWKHAIHQSISLLETWTRSAPENFASKFHLLIAEELSISSSDNIEILNSYNKAIKLARRYDLIHEEALASERAGLFCIERSLFTEGTKHISHAHRMYDKWGSKSKLDHLKSTARIYVKDPVEFSLDIFDKSNSQDIYVDVHSLGSLSELKIE